jgi:hypothetical protein
VPVDVDVGAIGEQHDLANRGGIVAAIVGSADPLAGLR